MHGRATLLRPLFAPPWMVELLAEHRRQIQVGDNQLFAELPATGHQLPSRVENDAAAVKDQLVLPADQVAECDKNQVVGGAGGQHPFPGSRFAGVVGRGRDVDHHLRPGQRLRFARPGRIPDVLADVDADGQRPQGDHEGLLPGPEVAVLIKDGIVRQIGLVVDGCHLALVEHGGRVVQVIGPVHKPDDAGDACR